MRCAWRSCRRIVVATQPQCFSSYGGRRVEMVAAARSRYSTKPLVSEAEEQVPVAVTAQEKKAAGSALATYLTKQGLGAAEVVGIRRSAPSFSTKLALLARDRDSQTPSKAMQKLLGDGTLKAAEAVLESMGGDALWVEEALSLKMDSSDAGVCRLVELVHCFEKVGVPRKEIWKLFDSNELLWKSSASEVEEGITMLGLGNKEVSRLLQRCPQLVGQNSENLLQGIGFQLQQLSLGQQYIYGLMMLFEPTTRTSPSIRPITDILREHGVGKEDAGRCLESEALVWLTRINSVVSSAKSWFLDKGIEEHVFWKLMLQSTKGVYRSREALSTQLDTLTRYGLSQSEALELLMKQSHFLVWNDSILRQKLDYLVNSMGYSIQVLLSQPRYLTCSLESRIKPRHQLLRWLENNAAGSPKPGDMLFLFRSEEEFLRVYGKCHPDAVAVYKQLQQEAESGIQKQTLVSAASSNDASSLASSVSFEAESNFDADKESESGLQVERIGEVRRVDLVQEPSAAARQVAVEDLQGTLEASKVQAASKSITREATVEDEQETGGGAAGGPVTVYKQLQQKAGCSIGKQALDSVESTEYTSSSTSPSDATGFEPGSKSRREKELNFDTVCATTGRGLEKINGSGEDPHEQTGTTRASAEYQEGTPSFDAPAKRIEDLRSSVDPAAITSLQETKPVGGAHGVVGFFRRLLRLGR